jgi:hypothetical protein
MAKNVKIGLVKDADDSVVEVEDGDEFPSVAYVDGYYYVYNEDEEYELVVVDEAWVSSIGYNEQHVVDEGVVYGDPTVWATLDGPSLSV